MDEGLFEGIHGDLFVEWGGKGGVVGWCGEADFVEVEFSVVAVRAADACGLAYVFLAGDYFVHIFLSIGDKLAHIRVTTIKEPHPSQHHYNNHVETKQHMADLILRSAFLVQVLTDCRLWVGDVLL